VESGDETSELESEDLSNFDNEEEVAEV